MKYVNKFQIGDKVRRNNSTKVGVIINIDFNVYVVKYEKPDNLDHGFDWSFNLVESKFDQDLKEMLK